LLRPSFESRCRVPQTCVGQDTELLRLTLNAGLLMPAFEVSMLLLDARSAF